MSNNGGCDCWGGAAGARVEAIFEDDGGFAVLTGSLSGSTLETRSVLTVSGRLPRRPTLVLDGGAPTPPSQAVVDAGRREDRLLSTAGARRFQKVASRTETCGRP